ncbi:hypothetical protein PTSG_10708 [Salpingoeca rosetta]|uniref:Peptidase C39-like domain-containing protein n=1 Tax=Salpingoeca rosetta (strain ATCC 50818 / BSB-021) TaxID=946362 RepID=F2UQ56_SALR5|nr:uncharacterized protein PTSG_10708 [Salpingoeca rosetta]EGD79724.1 hypothetical protein PTSG_10708 [Salpingoeca rosetta]|eukprot:XP_004988673.1 hypothetical protein PTSG_10708 [Salpingoeca rosetta]
MKAVSIVLIAVAVMAATCLLSTAAAPVTMHLHKQAVPMPMHLHNSNATIGPQPNCPGWTMFKQCDSRWGGDRLGTSPSDTICTAGCAMSSVAMLLHTRGLGLDPGSLNNWLINNGGYESGDLILWGSVDKLGKTSFQGLEKPALSDVISGIQAVRFKCHGIIANVRGGSHWVLLTGFAGGSTFNVNDPYYSTSQYTYADMLRLAVYH